MAEVTIDDQSSRSQRTRASLRSGARTVLRGLAVGVSIDQVMAVLAVLFIPAGIAAILLGWSGAAHTPFLFEQIPYLISGGLLGVGLLTAGGLLYVGSWVARSAQLQRERDEQLQGVLGALRDELQRQREQSVASAPAAAGFGPATEAAAGVGVAPGGLEATSASADAQTTEIAGPAAFVATPSGTMFHRPECSVVAKRSDDELRRVTGQEPGMRPCGICSPLED